MNTTYKNSINKNERIILGCQALSGESVTKIAKKNNTNREFVYEQKAKVTTILNKNFDEKEITTPIILMNEKLINRLILSCSLDCKGSIRDVKELFKNVFNFDISEGKISKVLNEAAEKAIMFNQSINLSTINIGAHDEIFQAGDPVLVGVDPLSTYVYLMQGSKKRDAISWSMAIYEKCINQELNIKTSVTDGGLGMKKGIREIYPDLNEQSDIFHAEMKLTVGLSILERKAYGAINKEYEKQNKFQKISEKKKAEKEIAYIKAVSESNKAIEIYDSINTAINWIKELFSVGGYCFDERIQLIEYVINQVNNISHGNKQLEDALKSISLNKENLLLFVKTAHEQIQIISEDNYIHKIILNLLWKQKIYSEKVNNYWIIENEILKLSDIKTIENIKESFRKMIKTLVRASSIVECINSLIRPYLFLKRTLKGKFLDLLQFYLNTRKYMNSRVEERKGKSPLELLTGKEHSLWLDILGY